MARGIIQNRERKKNPFDHDDELAFTHHPRQGIGPS
jgi:hypothetical protein